ncbi:unnamed protein product [Closterium sp. NIES-65]|nr:unnamed protein product [Closterium sp. NIES-65]
MRAEQHVRKLREERPELLGEKMVKEAVRGAETGVRSIKVGMACDWGTGDLRVGGWEGPVWDKAQEQEEAERESKEVGAWECLPVGEERQHTMENATSQEAEEAVKTVRCCWWPTAQTAEDQIASSGADGGDVDGGDGGDADGGDADGGDGGDGGDADGGDADGGDADGGDADGGDADGVDVGSVEKRRRELQDEMNHLAADIGRHFLAASRRRRVAAEDLGERVEGVLRGLEMGAARFRAVVSWSGGHVDSSLPIPSRLLLPLSSPPFPSHPIRAPPLPSPPCPPLPPPRLQEPAAPHFYSATSAPLSQSQLSMQERRRGGGGEGVRARRVAGSGGWGREVESEWEEEGEGDEEEEREEEEEEDDEEEEEGEEEEESGQQRQHGTEILVEERLIRAEGAESVGERSDVFYRYSSTGMDRVGGMSTRVGGMSVMCIAHLPHADTHISVSAGGKKGKDKVICITHLPQVAVYADAHIVVSKHMDGVDGRMRTTAAPLLPLHSPCPTPPFPQVICITHLPQVAVHADAHISVSKQIGGADGRMRTTAARLTSLEERASEVAQMLGLGLPSALELFKAKGGMERAVNTVNTERHLKAVQRDA